MRSYTASLYTLIGCLSIQALGLAPIFDELISTQSLTLRQNQNASVVSTSGSCGLISGVGTTCKGSSLGDCCSHMGFCGSNSSYCGSGCQSQYGDCGDSNISTDGSCGGKTGLNCRGYVDGNCCSANGFCGDTVNHCSVGCQTAFGDCYAASNTTNSISSTSLISSTNVASSTNLAGSTATSSIAPTSSASASSATSTSSSTPTSSATMTPAKSSISTGGKAGIGVGVGVAGLALLSLLGWFLRRRRQRRSPRHLTSAESHDHDCDIKADPHELDSSVIHEVVADYGMKELHSTEHAPVELPATEGRYRHPESVVDKRAAAGYEGAYRGH